MIVDSLYDGPLDPRQSFGVPWSIGIKHSQQADFLTLRIELLSQFEGHPTPPTIPSQKIRALGLERPYFFEIVRRHLLHVAGADVVATQPEGLQPVKGLIQPEMLG